MSERQGRAEKIITGHVTFGIISGYTRKKSLIIQMKLDGRRGKGSSGTAKIKTVVA